MKSERGGASSARVLVAGDELYRTAFEKASVGACLLDERGTILRANQALCEMLGYTAAELTGLSFSDVTHADDAPLSTNFLASAMRGEVTQARFEKRYVHKSGSIIWAQLSVAVVDQDAGRPRFVVAYVQDITERKQAELERAGLVRDLRRTADSRRAILEAMPEAITVFSREGTILDFKGARDVPTVLDPGAFVGKNLSGPALAYLPIAALREKLAQSFETRETQYLDFEVVVDGAVRSRSSTLRAISDDEAVWVSRDVTAQVQTTRRIAESEIKMRVALNAARMGMFEWDMKRDRFEWDDVTCQIFGVTQETMPRGRVAFRQVVHPEDRDRVRSLADVALETGVYRAIEYRIVRPDGTTRWTATRGAVTFDPDGTPAKIVGGVLDVTAERDLDDRRRLSQKLESIGQLSAGVAHNFNNMLMGILPNVELALEGATPETAELLQGARESTLRAAELVRQLMTFAGRARSARKTAQDLSSLVRRTLQICERAFDASIALPAAYPDRPQLVLADPTQIEQALLNVLINARDAVSDAHVAAPCVQVTVDSVDASSPEVAHSDLAPHRDYVRVRIADNGPGMDDAVRSRIFDPFFTTKDVGRGTGLGLSTTLAIVREHGGSIDCVSAPGAGAAFSIYLPTTAPAEAPGTSPPHAPASRGSETVFVVDDESAVRTVVKRILEGHGYEVLVAASGREALERLSDPEVRGKVALVLLDMSMPSMSGPAVRSRLSELAPALRVAYFTGYSATAEPADVDGVITKPIKTDALLARIREILDRPPRT